MTTSSRSVFVGISLETSEYKNTVGFCLQPLEAIKDAYSNIQLMPSCAPKVYPVLFLLPFLCLHYLHERLHLQEKQEKMMLTACSRTALKRVEIPLIQNYRQQYYTSFFRWMYNSKDTFPSKVNMPEIQKRPTRDSESWHNLKWHGAGSSLLNKHTSPSAFTV